MPSSRVLKGVLHNFLSTLKSRYSDLNGYWIFGFLVEETDELDIDLLEVRGASDLTPASAFRHLAHNRFHDQTYKAKFPVERLGKAMLYWRRSEPREVPSVWGPQRGYRVVLEVAASVPSGREFRRATSEYVLPHNPARERQSGRVV
ncbi:MAG: hypothetical protein U0X73_08310 [Thermoanaerobaculia bacterium]